MKFLPALCVKLLCENRLNDKHAVCEDVSVDVNSSRPTAQVTLYMMDFTHNTAFSSISNAILPLYLTHTQCSY